MQDGEKLHLAEGGCGSVEMHGHHGNLEARSMDRRNGRVQRAVELHSLASQPRVSCERALSLAPRNNRAWPRSTDPAQRPGESPCGPKALRTQAITSASSLAAFRSCSASAGGMIPYISGVTFGSSGSASSLVDGFSSGKRLSSCV